MLVSCLCPTYHRPELLAEAVESFLRQDYPHRELLVGNDAPEQEIVCDLPGVRVLNHPRRFPSLNDKLNWLLTEARGELVCRWDDDDISLPHRLSLSVERLRDQPEWRAENYWYCPPVRLEHVAHPGNTHVTAIWRRNLSARLGIYTPGRSGDGDQEFNRRLKERGVNDRGELLRPDEIFYLYRWGVAAHLSAVGDESVVQAAYIAQRGKTDRTGRIEIAPGWRRDYAAWARAAAVQHPVPYAPGLTSWEQ